MTAADGRGLVLDANILIRLVLGQRVRDLVLDHAHRIAFFAPLVCYDDARKYLPALLLARGVEPGGALELLDRFEAIVRPVEEIAYASARRAALARIGNRDERDWPVLATALVLELPIWTEDRNFLGVGVPTWTTESVGYYLRDPATDATDADQRS